MNPVLVGILCALIGAGATITASLLPRQLDARKARAAAEEAQRVAELVHDALGKKNGQGTAIEMLEKSLVLQAQHAQRDELLFGIVFSHLGLTPPPKSV